MDNCTYFGTDVDCAVEYDDPSSSYWAYEYENMSLLNLTKLWVRLSDEKIVGFMLASGLSIVVISMDRLRGIVYPFHRKLSRGLGLFIILIIWVLSILFALPFIKFRKYKERQWADYLEKYCGENFEQSKTYWTVMIVLVVYFPFVAVIFAYTIILKQLEKYESQVRNREHISKTKNKRKTYVSQWQKTIDFIAHYLAYNNGVTNPFIYGASNENYRKAFFKRFPFLQKKKNKVVPTIDLNKVREDKRTHEKFGRTRSARTVETQLTVHTPD
ncbi:Neuropeptide FF receptor 2 [Nymphon striatum]|nr:Neuropeptide FF receptor 2 [Nymphon striatum]